MIASENFVSEAVLEALGTVLTNKYAEGYPGRRYYGGCEFVDVAESLAIARAKQLFGADHANVQPHSGAQANTAVYMAALKPGDTILGMNLSHGGHLTHGHPLNFSGKYFNVVAYGVRKEDERIDYEELAAPGASSTSRRSSWSAPRPTRAPSTSRRCGAAADASGALVMADIAHIAGLVAAGLHPSPVPHCEFVTTTTHKTLRGPRGGLILCQASVGEGARQGGLPRRPGRPAHARDRGQGGGLQGGADARSSRPTSSRSWRTPRRWRRRCRARAGGSSPAAPTTTSCSSTCSRKGITGKVAEKALDKAGITVNKNTIPFDTNSPMVASGIRLGTPALTTRGMKEARHGRGRRRSSRAPSTRSTTRPSSPR